MLPACAVQVLGELRGVGDADRRGIAAADEVDEADGAGDLRTSLPVAVLYLILKRSRQTGGAARQTQRGPSAPAPVLRCRGDLGLFQPPDAAAT